jgi:hypothetical protein
MSAATIAAAAAPIADFQQVRFDRALADLGAAAPDARVALDERTGLAIGIDAEVRMPMPAAAQALPAMDRAAAASVLFLDQFGPLVGVAGWHVLEPRFASPIGDTVWLTFEARCERHGTRLINVCASGDMVRHVRVERS